MTNRVTRHFRGKLIQILFDRTDLDTNETIPYGFAVLKFVGDASCKYFLNWPFCFIFKYLLYLILNNWVFQVSLIKAGTPLIFTIIHYHWVTLKLSKTGYTLNEYAETWRIMSKLRKPNYKNQKMFFPGVQIFF